MSLPQVSRAPTGALDAERPRHRARTVLLSALAGVVLAVVWSYELVDSVIGDTVADTLLGHDAKGAALTSTAAGLLFALVSGLAGTFTACNIAVVASTGPMSRAGGAPGRRATVPRSLLRPVAALTGGMVLVSAVYGFGGALLVALAVFTVVYWDLRVPSLFGIGWFPHMPYR